MKRKSKSASRRSNRRKSNTRPTSSGRRPRQRQQRGGEGDIFEYIDSVRNVDTFDYADFERRFERQFSRKKVFGTEDITPIIHAYRTNQKLFFGFLKHIPELALYKTSNGRNLMLYVCNTAIPETQSSVVNIMNILDVNGNGSKYMGLDQKDSDGMTALQRACHRSLDQVVIKLLSYGAEAIALSHVSKDGYTALMYACMSSHTSMFHVISEMLKYSTNETNASHTHPVSGMTAFIIVCSKKHESVALEMLDRYSAKDCNVGAVSANHLTALIVCCVNELYKVINRILDFPANDINLSYVDKRNNTVLHCICLHGYKAELKFDEHIYALEIAITDLEKLKNTMDDLEEISRRIEEQVEQIRAKEREYRNIRNLTTRMTMRDEIASMKNKLEHDESKRAEYETTIDSGLETYHIEGRSTASKKENLNVHLDELKKAFDTDHKKMEKIRNHYIPTLEALAVKIIRHGANACNLYHRANENDPKSTVYHYAITRGMNKVVYEIDRLRYDTTMYHMKPRTIEITEDDTIFDPIMMEDTPITEYLKEEENQDKVVIRYKDKMYIVGIGQIRDSITVAKRYPCKTAGSYADSNINTLVALYDVKKISDIVIDGSIMYNDMIHINPKKTRFYVLEETNFTYPSFISASLADATKTMSLVSMTHCNPGAGGKAYKLIPAILPRRASTTQRSPPRSASKRTTPPRRGE